jgi:hypothetical protein
MEDREDVVVILKGLVAHCKSKDEVMNALRKYASDAQMDQLEEEVDALYGIKK